MRLRTVAALFLLSFLSTIVLAQTRVANYSIGKFGDEDHEKLMFYVRDGKRSDIFYQYGTDDKEMKLQYGGKVNVNGMAGFKVLFPNKTSLLIFPKGDKLDIKNPASSSYTKTFSWAYEGPVNGVGMFCDVCAEDEREAMSLLKTNYLR